MALTNRNNKLIILDRDGVLNDPGDGAVIRAEDWQPIAGSMDAVAFLTQAGYLVVVATNQSGLARGLLRMQDLNEVHAKLHLQVQKAGGRIDGIWFCPHSAEADCDCRKPKTGLITDILDRLNVAAANTWLVGDSLRDLQAIAAAGGHPVLVRTGKGHQTLAAGQLPEHTLVFDDLLAFSQYRLQEDAAAAAKGVV